MTDKAKEKARPVERLFASKKSYATPLVSELPDGLGLLANSICNEVAKERTLSPEA